MRSHILRAALLAAAAFTPALVHAESAPSGAAAPGGLARRAFLGASFQPTGVVIDVRPEGTGEAAGLKAGDKVVKIGNTAIKASAEIAPALRAVRAGQDLKITVEREGKTVELAAPAKPQPAETVPGGAAEYGAVTAPGGYMLRTITTVPTGASAQSPRPAVLFIQGLMCQSVDNPLLPTPSPDVQILHQLTEAGLVTMRVDKPGMGDSLGPPCGDIDFETELAGYKVGLDALMSRPDVDKSRVYVLGHSMGGVMAPVMAAGRSDIRGLIVYGTVNVTWMEYVLDNARRQARLQGMNDADITRYLQRLARVQAQMLLEKKTFEQIFTANPELRFQEPMMDGVRQYGRHVTFFHQLQDVNLDEAWSKVNTRTLAVHGEYDWVVPDDAHTAIARIVSNGRPGRGESLTIPAMDHAFTTHESLIDSLSAVGQGQRSRAMTDAILAWMKADGRS